MCGKHPSETEAIYLLTQFRGKFKLDKFFVRCRWNRDCFSCSLLPLWFHHILKVSRNYVSGKLYQTFSAAVNTSNKNLSSKLNLRFLPFTYIIRCHSNNMWHSKRRMGSKCHTNYFALETLLLCKVELFCLAERFGIKRYFLFNSFSSSNKTTKC
jgi:hypothetical protein